MKTPKVEERVAAILYFEDGSTLEEVKQFLQRIARETKTAHPLSNSVPFNRMDVRSYNAAYGYPVWYIP